MGETGMGESLAEIHAGDVDLAWEDGEGRPRVDFETGPALAVLLAREVVFTNAQHWRADLSEADRATVAVFVNCSDVFAWGVAEGEILPFGEVERLYRMWRRDGTWGAAAWAILVRARPPQAPVAARIAAAGVWDIPRLLAPDARAYADAVSMPAVAAAESGG